MTQRDASVVISYAQGNNDPAVLALANRLNLEGVDCDVDLYEEAPAEGWARWMEAMMTRRTVLVVASSVYYERYHRRAAAGAGLGVTFESGLLIQRAVEGQGENRDIIPILFDGSDRQYIPEFLRDTTFYDLSNSDGYDRLYRRLTTQPMYEKPPLGVRRTLPIIAGNSVDASDEREDPALAELREAQITQALQHAVSLSGLYIPSYVCSMTLIINPVPFTTERIEEDDERRIIESARDHSALYFPISDTQHGINLEDGFHVTTLLPRDGARPDFREYYRFRRSGLFVLTRVSPDDIDTAGQYRDRDRFIGVGTLVSTLTTMLRFAAQLAIEFNEHTRAVVVVSGLANHQLIDDLADHPLILGALPVAHQDRVEASFAGSPADFTVNSTAWALSAIVKCLRALNYPATSAVARGHVEALQRRLR